MKVGPTRTLVWLETDVEGVQPWQPELLETTGTWTGLQAWKQNRCKNLAYCNALTRNATVVCTMEPQQHDPGQSHHWFTPMSNQHRSFLWSRTRETRHSDYDWLFFLNVRGRADCHSDVELKCWLGITSWARLAITYSSYCWTTFSAFSFCKVCPAQTWSYLTQQTSFIAGSGPPMMEMAVMGPLQMITGAKTQSEMATAGLCKGWKQNCS